VTIRERISKLDHLQKGTLFKIVVSSIIAIVAVVLIGYALMNNTAENTEMAQLLDELPSTVTNFAGDEIDNPQLAEAMQIQRLLSNARPGTLLAVGAGVVSVLLILVVWMGLGLIYPLLLALAAGIYYALHETSFDIFGSIVVGMLILTLSFMVLMRATSIALSSSHPVTAIARNVLAEAIRMKISLVFIVMLFFVLAALPMLLNDDQSLRYRVQNFLQYASGFTFVFIALLVVFFGAATVTYEQREKVIWQTMTKPVTAWQYLLGKWLGVVALAAILLAVSATGVFLFTEYLRNQPAVGELEAYQAADGSGITEDRLILETQVLTSRMSVRPTLPFSINDPVFESALDSQIQREREFNQSYNPNPAERAVLKNKLFQDEISSYLSIDPLTEKYEEFVFNGLGSAKAMNLPLTLRYKINAEGNRPDIFYILTFGFDDGTVLPPRRTGLGFSHSMPISPDFINSNGQIRIQIINGQLFASNDGNFDIQTNINTFTIPPDGLEISYSVGGYRANFVRVFFVLWVKLAMLGMLAVWASTFASFPVACLISGGMFFIGQSSGFVQDSLPGWGKTTVDGDPSIFRTVIYYFADWVSSLFKVYNDLKPTSRLSDGQMLSWRSVSRGVIALGTISAVFYIAGIVIFRRRQLAIYSGQ
jgi:ABC-type transport system involved in multi-copper enzyme maturation permease subunit